MLRLIVVPTSFLGSLILLNSYVTASHVTLFSAFGVAVSLAMAASLAVAFGAFRAVK